MWIIGSCGCNYRHCLDSDMNECPCPMCPSKTTQESFSRNVAGGMVEGKYNSRVRGVVEYRKLFKYVIDQDILQKD